MQITALPLEVNVYVLVVRMVQVGVPPVAAVEITAAVPCVVVVEMVPSAVPEVPRPPDASYLTIVAGEPVPVV